MASGRILDLLQLQNLTKRDPSAYKDEFLQQFNHYKTQLNIFQLKPTKDYKHFAQLVSYLSHVCKCYPKELSEFPKQISDLLEHSCNNLEPDLRRILAKSLILMRNRDLLPQITLLSLFFKLFRVHDKPLRSLLYSYIVSDIKNTNLKSKNVKLNKSLQNFMFTMMNDDSEIASKMSLKVMVELFRKKVWHDTKTVNVISNGVFSKNSKIIITTLNFFLHIDNPDRVDSDDENEASKKDKAKEKYRKSSLSLKVGKKTKSRQTRLNKTKSDFKKAKEEELKKLNPNFPAIELIHDPQGYCEKLFNLLQKTTETFETRILMMNFISRLIFTHKLMIYNFYPFLQKYLQPHQKEITYILAVLAQSCHELVDPDVLKPIISTIAKYFVNDGCNPEVIAIGLNTIRAIASRCPLSMDKVLLADLIQYKDKKEKGVKMASTSLLHFFRENYPSLLPKKERGKKKTDIQPLEFGAQKIHTAIDGVELLYDEELNRELDQHENADDDDDEFMDIEDDEEMNDIQDDDGWESASDEEDEEEKQNNWKEVKDGEEIEVSDDEEDDDEEEDEEDDGEWEEVSDDEDDENEEEWEEVSDDEQEEEEEEEEDKETTEQQKVVQKKTIPEPDDLGLKILSDQDIERIKKLKALRDSKSLKRPLEAISQDDDDENVNGYIDPMDLRGEHKKRKASLEERIALVKEGRKDRDYGSKTSRKKRGKMTSTTNEQKEKTTKPFMLMKKSNKVRSKQTMSIRDRQIKKSKHIAKQAKGRH
ncbi:SDA1 domain-containing protein [Tieghemostelium lacteum]|uniref:Protein SDA1 n=1 Tax=Tieghemostelium lacteum TaxID=361077 RepID=A0A151Z5F2_TIELA|nr:SDA1 domain-containing protein [Tieghemostelium lacteum]|eukprot:KYQ89192.1 SDA1 domain-containing protein [Tieghemostelium lacteum]